MKKLKVTFYPGNKTVEAEEGKTILSAAISAGIQIHSSCGGDGLCGKCKVIVKSGKVITQSTGAFEFNEKKQGIYLACITTIHSDLEVEIFAQTRLDERPQEQVLEEKLKKLYSESEEVDSGGTDLTKNVYLYSPLAIKIYLELTKPDLKDAISDLERVYRQIHKVKNLPLVQTSLTNIRQLGELLRDADWKVTVTLVQRNDAMEVVLIEPGDTSSSNLGLCFDIGTTTISGQLVDLNNKNILGTKAIYNKQATFGSDVISRIIHAQESDGLEQLHLAVNQCINHIIEELTKEHQVDLNNLNCIVCAGNTTMIHLLLSIDPTYIRRDPYVPTANFLPVIRAAEAGIKINPRGLLFSVPGVSSYVGGDVTAGVLACGLYKEDELSLLIDIGTNGEIVLGSKEFLIAASASAGPAFEGSGVSSGMRASRGAIQKVKISPKNLEISCSIIGDVEPAGICGSGYIDIISQMLKVGLLDKSGKLNGKDCARLRNGKDGREFVLFPAEDSASGLDIVITEADIENLKRSKAAIYAATTTLIKHMGFELGDINKIFIAGGFGNYIDIDSAVNIGLLPDVDRSRFIFIGNSSLSGARSMLLSYQAFIKAEEIAKKITYCELSVEPGYMDEYMAALFYPHTDLRKFPTF